MELATIVVYGLAVYRLSHLVVIDHWISKTRKKVVFGIRDAYEKNTKNKVRKFIFFKLFGILTCMFCVSVWFSFFWFTRHFHYVNVMAQFLAVASIASIVGDLSQGKYIQVLEIDKTEARRQDADI